MFLLHSLIAGRSQPVSLITISMMNLSSSTEPATKNLMEPLSSVGQTISATFLGLAFLLGAPGNLLVIWIIWRHVKPRTHTILLILHLAAADLLVLITLPLWIYSLVYSWVFGEVFCQTVVYVIHVCMYSSIFLITLMSIERFVAVRYPFVIQFSRTQTVLDVSLIAAWVLALLLGVPAILTQEVSEGVGGAQCLFRNFSSVAQERTIISLETIAGFVVPFTIMSICYCLVASQLRESRFQDKRKVLLLIASLVLAFTLCWLPHHINNIIQLVCTSRSRDSSCGSDGLTLIAGALVFVSSSVNPVLYAFAARRSKVRIRGLKIVRFFQEVATHTKAFRGTRPKEADSECESTDRGQPLSHTFNLRDG
ncbi:unnamed protein product [Boreogadus saida]